MALIKYGGGIVQMSGSIAGSTHARNRFGNYMRARTKPVNPRSARQTTVRNLLNFLVEEWKDSLSAAQRTAWGSYASAVSWTNRLGETVSLTGFNHFVRSGIARRMWAGSYLAAGPTELSLPAGDGNFQVAVSEANGLTVTFNDGMDWVSEDNAAMAIIIGTPQNSTRNFFNGPWRFDSALGGSSGAPKTNPEGPNAITAWTLTAGQRVWVKAHICRADGRVSTDFFADSVIVGA